MDRRGVAQFGDDTEVQGGRCSAEESEGGSRFSCMRCGELGSLKFVVNGLGLGGTG